MDIMGTQRVSRQGVQDLSWGIDALGSDVLGNRLWQ